MTPFPSPPPPPPPKRGCISFSREFPAKFSDSYPVAIHETNLLFPSPRLINSDWVQV